MFRVWTKKVFYVDFAHFHVGHIIFQDGQQVLSDVYVSFLFICYWKQLMDLFYPQNLVEILLTGSHLNCQNYIFMLFLENDCKVEWWQRNQILFFLRCTNFLKVFSTSPWNEILNNKLMNKTVHLQISCSSGLWSSYCCNV